MEPRLFLWGKALPTACLCAETCMWANDILNRMVRIKEWRGTRSPYKLFDGKPPPPILLPFLKLGYRHVYRDNKSSPKGKAYFYLNGVVGHLSDRSRAMLRVVSRTPGTCLEHPRQPFAGVRQAAE